MEEIGIITPQPSVRESVVCLFGSVGTVYVSAGINSPTLL